VFLQINCEKIGVFWRRKEVGWVFCRIIEAGRVFWEWRLGGWVFRKRMEAGWVIERKIWSLGGIFGEEMENGRALRKRRMEVWLAPMRGE
jgi:hypothetical protein